MQNHVTPNGNTGVVTMRVAIAGIVKSAVTNLPLESAEISAIATRKSTVSNSEGLLPSLIEMLLPCSGDRVYI